MECAHLAFVFLDSYRTAICPTSGTALQVQPQPPPGPAAPALPPGRSEPFGQIPANTRSAVQVQSWCRRQPGPSRKPSFIGPEDATHTRRQHPALAPPCAVSFWPGLLARRICTGSTAPLLPHRALLAALRSPAAAPPSGASRRRRQLSEQINVGNAHHVAMLVVWF
jgi:hypothetical protein